MSVKALVNYVLEEVAIDGEQGTPIALICVYRALLPPVLRSCVARRGGGGGGFVQEIYSPRARRTKSAPNYLFSAALLSTTYRIGIC